MIVKTATTVFGPFKSVELLDDRLRCDGVDLPLSVIGGYVVVDDDSLAPPTTPPAPVVPVVPVKVSMRQARLALLQQGLLAGVDSKMALMPEAARIEWEYATDIERANPWVAELSAALGRADSEMDGLFILAASL